MLWTEAQGQLAEGDVFLDVNSVGEGLVVERAAVTILQLVVRLQRTPLDF